MGTDSLGILELIYKEETLIMMNAVQKVVNVSHQFLPLQNTFVCNHFAVAGVENPGVLKVHALDSLTGRLVPHDNCQENEFERKKSDSLVVEHGRVVAFKGGKSGLNFVARAT
jgi:hypothetical protein